MTLRRVPILITPRSLDTRAKSPAVLNTVFWAFVLMSLFALGPMQAQVRRGDNSLRVPKGWSLAPRAKLDSTSLEGNRPSFLPKLRFGKSNFGLELKGTGPKIERPFIWVQEIRSHRLRDLTKRQFKAFARDFDEAKFRELLSQELAIKDPESEFSAVVDPSSMRIRVSMRGKLRDGSNSVCLHGLVFGQRGFSIVSCFATPEQYLNHEQEFESAVASLSIQKNRRRAPKKRGARKAPVSVEGKKSEIFVSTLFGLLVGFIVLMVSYSKRQSKRHHRQGDNLDRRSLGSGSGDKDEFFD